MPARHSQKSSSIRTAAALAEQVRRFRLLPPEQLAQLSPLSAHFDDDIQQLARFLVRSGWLTRYQVEQLARGRGEELRLGRYVVLDLLGEGGMGLVFKARQEPLGGVVALKRIHPQYVENETAVRRFQREVRSAAQLDHPNIVKALDADTAQGVHMLVMEFVPGIDLARLVRDQGALPIAQACEILRQAALGLQHAHECGLVHRDIKPHNLILTPAGTVKILDMGLARREARLAGEASGSTLTREGAVLGTVDFIAPEQAADARSADARSDLYALGCTLYFLLTGQVPFPEGEPLTKLLKHRLEEPLPVEEFRGDVPPQLVALLTRLTAKKPADRFQSVAELLGALEQVPRTAARLAVPKALPAALPVDPFAGLYSDDDAVVPVASPAGQRVGRGRGYGMYLFLALLMFGIGGLMMWMLLGQPGLKPTGPGGPTPVPRKTTRSEIRQQEGITVSQASL